jgi:hypothetical protein
MIADLAGQTVAYFGAEAEAEAKGGTTCMSMGPHLPSRLPHRRKVESRGTRNNVQVNMLCHVESTPGGCRIADPQSRSGRTFGGPMQHSWCGGQVSAPLSQAFFGSPAGCELHFKLASS